jgi:TonB-linked SusC/RagA family outer membrane protein
MRVMKLTAILLTAFFLQVKADGLSQSISFSGKDVPLQKVLAAIKKQSGYVFFYKENILQDARPVTINMKNVTVEEAIRQVLKDQPFDYYIEKTTVVISKKKEVTRDENSVNTRINEAPASIDVSGKVMDEAGSPLVGANIVEKGKQNGTTTNADGAFVLRGVDENGSLVISYVGFQTLIIPVNSRSSIVVSIKQSDANLQEVVINKGYYTELKKFSTGNVATITSKDIEKQPIQNPLLALAGRVPGLEITQTTGMNGGGVKVRIQGINSLGSLNNSVGTEPLIVLDGVPYPSQFMPSGIENFVQYGSPLNYIRPSDIESISVLKDADATAIYGSRAANGAILITTKKGKAGKPKLSVDLQQGWGKVTRHVDMLNTRQYLDMRYEALKNDGLSPNPNGDYDLTLWDTTRYTDWQKELIGGTAHYTNINAGISGGTDLVQYLVGANFNRQTTVFPGDYSYKTGGMHFSVSGASPNQRLNVQLLGTYIYSENHLPFDDLTQYAVFLEPDAPKLYNTDGSINWALNASGRSTWKNPLVRTTNTEYSNATENLVGNLNLSYSLLPGLVVSSNFGYNAIRSDLFSGYKLGFYAPQIRARAERSASFGNRNINSWILEPQLRFERNISKGKLDALIGTTIQKSKGYYLEVNASGQPTDELLHSLAAATSITSAASGNSLDYTTRFNGLFGRIGYNWDKKYLINLTGRRDGSSKFGDENKFHNFWSAGAGWIFSEETFLQSSRSWLSFGKLRASYGTTGNDQIANYSYLSLYNIVYTDILYQGTTSFNVTGLSNPFLQWEETRKMQGGIDLALFNERIAFGITYARNRSSNQLIGYSLPSLTGFSNFTKNFPATIQNTSWEFSLNTVNVKSKNFNWITNFNLTIPRNKVTSFPGIELTSYAGGYYGVIVGEPIGVQKLYKYGGVDPATGSYMLIDSLGKAVVPTSFGSIKQSEKVSLLPKYYGGMTNTISYKGFQLDFLIQYVYQMGSKDNYYFNSNVPPGAFNPSYSNQPISVLTRWQKPDDNAAMGRYNSDYSLPILPPYTDAGYSYATGSYIRLKNLSLSWQLPKEWYRKTNLRNAQIYFRGQNLITITGYNGLDPETRSLTTLPPLQMWTVGAKIEL